MNQTVIKTKRGIISILLVCFSLTASAQFFQPAENIHRGQFLLSIDPVFANHDNGLNLAFRTGITSRIDIGGRYGFHDGYNFFGADLHWLLLPGKPAISLITGVHNTHNTGLDLGLNVAFPINGSIRIYSGLLADMEFASGNNYTAVWLPIGVQIHLKRHIALSLEGDLPIKSGTNGMFTAGLKFYF